MSQFWVQDNFLKAKKINKPEEKANSDEAPKEEAKIEMQDMRIEVPEINEGEIENKG